MYILKPSVVILKVDVEKEPMGVDYGSLTPVLVAAIQELKAENDTIKMEIEQLKENLLAMNERQSAVEDMLFALSTAYSKEKLVKLDKINSDQVQKTTQYQQ